MRSVRLVTLNLWGTRDPLEARLDVAAGALDAVKPDVVFLQEIRRDNGKTTTADSLAKRLGESYEVVYAPATRGDAGTWGAGTLAGEEGLAILSRFPVLKWRHRALPVARPNDRRILLSAHLELASEAGEAARTIWAHTTHLHWRLTDGVAREKQVVAIEAALRDIDESALHVVAGDFNAAPDTDEIRFLTGRTTLAGRRTHLQDAFARIHPNEPGWTWARANPMTAWLSWLDLDRRIDYVFVSTERRDGRGRVLDSRVVLDEPGDRGVYASDHFAVLADVNL